MNKPEELYKLFLVGNKDAFNEIIVIYQEQLTNFILGYVHDLDVAEDLAQDTFLYVLINQFEYDFKYSLKTYLYTIAKSRAINYLKREQRKVDFNESYMYEYEEIDFNKGLEKEYDIKIVREGMKKLKQEYRTVIYLKDFQNFEYKEICQIINRPMYQTKMLIHRARKSLKKKIEKGGYRYDE
ncbi:MAG: RNA polymerase sigma factor [Clostridia bacterium]|nr:RNA polymerase sigma factor [Clostridia bacterium]